MEAATAKERHFMFHDDTLPTFFRRLCWSPDGMMRTTDKNDISTHSTSSTLC